MTPELMFITGLDSTTVEPVVTAMRRFADTVVIRYALDRRECTRQLLRGPDSSTPVGVRVVGSTVPGSVAADLRAELPRVAADATVRRIVVWPPTGAEPDALWPDLVREVDDGSGTPPGVARRGVVAVVDEPKWLADATGSDTLAARGLAGDAADTRTVAQVAVALAEAADAIALVGRSPLSTAVRTGAVLARLAPGVSRRRVGRDEDVGWMLDRGAAEPARPARGFDVHGRLLRGEPLLSADAGVQWLLFSTALPMHAERLHALVPYLLNGSVRARGRIWLATRPDEVLWLESAGRGLRIERTDHWLAATGERAWASATAERRAFAALRWHSRFGDRAQDLVVLTHSARRLDLASRLRAAVLTRAELAAGERAWSRWPDPFGAAHIDPCESPPGVRAATSAPHTVPRRA